MTSTDSDDEAEPIKQVTTIKRIACQICRQGRSHPSLMYKNLVGSICELLVRMLHCSATALSFSLTARLA